MNDCRLRVEETRVQDRRVRYRAVLPVEAPSDGAAITMPLLLLHGLAGSADVWIRSLPYFAADELSQPVFAPDMPGCGYSEGAEEALNIEELADWTARFLDALKVERAHLAANSLGCQVALAFARRHPERAGGLVLIGPTTGKGSVPLWRYIAGLALNSSREPLIYKYVAARLFLQMGIRRYHTTVRNMMEDDTLPNAAAVTAPSLVVWGEHDTIIPEAAARALAAALPCGSFRAVEKAAHMLEFNSPDRFVRIAQVFWAESECLPRVERIYTPQPASITERGALPSKVKRTIPSPS